MPILTRYARMAWVEGSQVVEVEEVVVQVERRMSEVDSCFGEVREVRHRAQVAFHVLYLDPIFNCDYNSTTVALPTAIIDQKRREVVQDNLSYPIQLFPRRCDRYSPQTSSSS